MIRPVSITNKNPNFGHIITNDNSKTNNPRVSKPEFSQDLKQGFLAGLMVGTSLATVGSFMYKDNQIDNLLKDIAATKVYENADRFEIKDATEDKIPEFILISDNGDRTVYDFTSGKAYFDEDGELIEKY